MRGNARRHPAGSVTSVRPHSHLGPRRRPRRAPPLDAAQDEARSQQRPPVPINVSVLIGPERITVSPGTSTTGVGYKR